MHWMEAYRNSSIPLKQTNSLSGKLGFNTEPPWGILTQTTQKRCVSEQKHEEEMKLSHNITWIKEESVSITPARKSVLSEQCTERPPIIWQLKLSQPHWKTYIWTEQALKLTLKEKSSSAKDRSQLGVMQHTGINPVLPDAANPLCCAELAVGVCNENQLVPAIEKSAAWPWLLYPSCKANPKAPTF